MAQSLDSWRMYIDGKWSEGGGGPDRDVVNPASGAVFTKVPEASAAQAHAAIAAARRAQPGEHGVGVAHLGRTPAVPLERLVRVVGQRRAVPLEHRDVVALTGQRQRRAQSPHTGPDHHDLHCWYLALGLGGC